MTLGSQDIDALESLNERLASALNKADISAITDLPSERAVVLAPAQNAAKGAKVLDILRNMSLRYGGIKFLTTDLDPVGSDAALEIGTFSARPKRREGERVFFKYQFVWHRIGGEWKLASMVWNRAAEATRGAGRKAPAQAASQEM